MKSAMVALAHQDPDATDHELLERALSRSRSITPRLSEGDSKD